VNLPNFTSLNYDDSVPLRNLLRHVAPFVPKLPEAFAMDLLRQKYIDFARRTRMLACEIVMDYQSGVKDYYLVPPQDHEVYSIVGIDGGHHGYYWYGMQRTQVKTDFDVMDNNCIRLHNTPSVDRHDGLKVFVNLLPKACIDYMPASVALPFGQDIGRGVVADALVIPGKDWTSPVLARKYELDYERMLLSARALSSSNRKIDSTSMKPVRIL